MSPVIDKNLSNHTLTVDYPTDLFERYGDVLVELGLKIRDAFRLGRKLCPSQTSEAEYIQYGLNENQCHFMTSQESLQRIVPI